jgi:hypothetical protein
VRISVDGRRVATVDLRTRQVTSQHLVYVKHWATNERRTITVEALGGGRIDVDAFLVLR